MNIISHEEIKYEKTEVLETYFQYVVEFRENLKTAEKLHTLFNDVKHLYFN